MEKIAHYFELLLVISSFYFIDFNAQYKVLKSR